jgi:ABC-type glycerol-3-phosphate transport system permease component
MKRRDVPGLAAGVFVMFLAFVVVLMPYLWMLITSFRRTPEILRNPGQIWPTQWVLTNYGMVFDETPFFSWLRNSVAVTFAVTLGVLFTASLVGYVFAKFRFKGKDLLFWLILSTMMVPSQITMIPSFLIINGVGLYDSLFALIIPRLVTAFGIFLCRQFCEDIPDSLCEAALIDGAGPFHIYRSVVIPLLRPCLAALAIFTFLENWNEYLMPLIMIEKVENMTLPIALSFFSGFRAAQTGAVMAAATLVMTPVTIVFLCFQKQFIKGITLTGMK